MNVNTISTTYSEQHSPQILTDFRLWSVLFTHMPAMPQIERSRSTRLSKPEAFFDLVNRHRQSLITHDEPFVNDSVQMLAQSWGWNRRQARTFLDELALTGSISLCSMAHRTVVRLHSIQVDPQHVSHGVTQHGSPESEYDCAAHEKSLTGAPDCRRGQSTQTQLKKRLRRPLKCP